MTCVYCGGTTGKARRVCQGHRDLPKLDPNYSGGLPSVAVTAPAPTNGKAS